MTHDLVFRGARLADESRGAVDVAVDGGAVVAIGVGLPEGIEEVSARGALLLPGLVDAHVHYREPGLEEVEGFAAGTLASAHGGATTVFEVQNNAPLMTSADALRAKLDVARRAARVRVGLFAGASRDAVTSLDELLDVAVGLKLYLSPCYGDPGVDADHTLRMLFERAARLDRVIAAFPEDRSEVERAIARHGTADPAAWRRARPATAELVACERLIALAETTGARLHVTPLSTAGAVDLVADARERGVRVTAGTFPHHLLFDDRDVAATGGLLKVHPSIKGEIDRDRLREAVRDGTIEVIESGHAPQPPAEKRARFQDVPPGVSSADVFLPLLFELLELGVLAGVDDLLERACRAPARLFGSSASGEIRVGSDADLVWAERSSWTPVEGDFASRATASPYVGRPFPARVVGTWIGGRRVFPATTDRAPT